MGINEVKSNTTNVNTTKLSKEEIAKRQEEFKKIQENGHEIVISAKGNNSGVSYDYMDRLNKDIEAGIFEDKDADGFTNKDKRALGNEFTSVFSEHGYSTKFTRMQKGDSFAISYDDYVRLANAAGYVLKEETPVEPVVTEPVVEQQVVPQEVKKQETTPTEVKTVTDNTQVDENQGEDVIVEFETTTVTDSEGNVIDKKSKSTVTPLFGTATAKKTTVTEPDALPAQAPKDKQTSAPAEAPVTPVVNSTKDVKTPVAQAPVTETPAVTPAAQTEETSAEEQITSALNNDPELQGKTPEERAKILSAREFNLSRQIRDLEKTTVTETKSRFLGLGKKQVTRNLTAEEIQARQAQANEMKAELDNTKKLSTYVDSVENQKYWLGKYASQNLKDTSGNVVADYPDYYRVVVTDAQGNEQKVARVDTYNPKTYSYDSKYYSLDVQKVGDPNMGYGEYYSVVPDMNNELTDITPRKDEYKTAR